MKFLKQVMRYFGMAQSENAPESRNFAGETLSDDRLQGAKEAAIAAALHHHEMQNSHNGGMLGIAALVAAIHHRNKIKK
jgi:Na+-transporting methylmalonyl-CoA/oxaloacetate decarboxylase gamma subunit